MRIQTKIATLLLTLPMAFANGLVGLIDATNGNITLETSPTVDTVDGASVYIPGVLNIALNNNAVGGWKATADSANGGYLQNTDTNGSTTAHRVTYDISCGAVTAGNNNGEAIASTSNISPVSDATISTETSPSYPSTGNVACSIDLASGEDMDQQFAGNYADTLTFSLSNL